MNQFIHDMIHMTEGEKLINYWWLYLIMICVVMLGSWIWGRMNK
jgi:hypothetical protein